MSESLQTIVDVVAAMPEDAAFMWSNTSISPEDVPTMRARVERCWPIWPTGQYPKGVSGLRIEPGSPLSKWSMADGARDVAGTRGSYASTATPVTTYVHMVTPRGTDRAMAALRATWPARRAGLAPLHALLGGDPAHLDALASIIFDTDIPPLGNKGKSRRPIDNRVFRLLDPAPEHIRFRDFLEHQFDHDDALPVPDGLGLWENFAIAIAFGRGYGDATYGSYFSHREPLSPVTIGLAWRLLHVAPQFDIGLSPNRVDHRNFTGGISSADALSAAMVAVSKAPPEQLDAWSDSPLFQAVLIPAAEDSQSPWHLGYMEAAAGYDGLEQPELAWNMLCAGAFWVNRRGGPWRPFFDAALSLSQRRGWTDCAAALENMADRARLE